jgi:glycosyltransferase involved in cell wall biosynthesis
MRRGKSILFVRPDFHCSFFYRDEFRKQGWVADIFVQPGYPEKLLYSNEDILRIPELKWGKNRVFRWLNAIWSVIWWLGKFSKYRYHLYYAAPPAFNFFEKRLRLTRFFGKDFLFELFLSKLFGVKLLYLPSGCHEDDLMATWKTFDNGNVCENCGYYDKCNDDLNKIKFDRIRRYFDFFVGLGFKNSREFKETHFKYKSIDLSLWNPDIKIPDRFLLSETKNLRILHSNYLKKSGRDYKNRNIKGSPYVHAAVTRLKSEGHPVEYMAIDNVASNEMRFYQAQADIVVDQLIFGSWGSTCVEALALGKPVVCYLRPCAKEFFLKNFDEYDTLPIIEADTTTIYDALKKLVDDPELRKRKAAESREFAESHFNPTRNGIEFIKLLNEI